jgi:hypothetical protein
MGEPTDAERWPMMATVATYNLLDGPRDLAFMLTGSRSDWKCDQIEAAMQRMAASWESPND